MAQDTRGGVNADPIAIPTMSAENEAARSVVGIELAMARAASGYAAASPTPSRNRSTIRIASDAAPAGTSTPGANPVSAVVATHTTAAHVNVRPGPIRSPDIPHGT